MIFLKNKSSIVLIVLFVVFLVIFISCQKDIDENEYSPTALFTVTPTSGDTLTIFIVDASESYDNEDPPSELQVSWDWQNNNIWTEYTTTKIASHKYDSAATYNIRLRVKDNSGWTGTNSREIVVIAQGNKPPGPPYNPTPANGDVNVHVETSLSWFCTDPEGDSLFFDIYLGTSIDPPVIAEDTNVQVFNPGTLENGVIYYWKIVAKDDKGNETEGDIWSFATEDPVDPCDNITSVNYEGKVYHTIVIGNQCWLDENLNVGIMINGDFNQTNNDTIEKYCYDNNPSNCITYGGLYQWDEMMQYTYSAGVQGICPEGWHIPSNYEWTLLTNFLGGVNIAGGKLKEEGTAHWNPPNTGANNWSGFTALAGGYRYIDSTFVDFRSSGNFWAATGSGSVEAKYIYLSYQFENLFYKNFPKSVGFSVRCLKD